MCQGEMVMEAIDRLTERLAPKGKLEHMYLNLTSLCNLKCFYCYDETYRAKKQEMLTLEEIQKIADDCKDLSLSTIALTGGEPFINKFWYEIGKMFFDAGVRVSYSTNGTLLTEEKMEKLANINAGIQISLDGNDEIMEFVSKGKNIYSKTLKTAELLKQHGINFMFNCVVGKHNIDFIDEFLENINSLGIRCRINFFCDEFNSKFQEYALTIQEKYNLIMKINDFNERTNNKNIFMALPPLMTPKYIPITMSPACGWAYNTAGILANGDVTVCGPASGVDYFKAGNIRNSSFKDIWNNSDMFTKLRNYNVSDLKGICSMCPVNTVCVGSCRVLPYLKYGDETASSALCQEFYNAVMDNKIDTDTFPIGSVKIKVPIK